MTQEVLKLALEALENISSFQNHTSGDSSDADKAITAIKEALKQTQVPVMWSDYESNGIHHKPVAWMDADGNVSDNNDHNCFPIPLYTAPPQPEPVAMVESVATVVSESGNQEVTMSWWHEPALPVGTKLYTTPQQRTEQEPFCLHWEDRWGCNHYADPKEPHPVNAKPLYTTPPQRTWVGLTDEKRSQLVTLHHGWNEYGQAIEANLKQQNGYAEENT